MENITTIFISVAITLLILLAVGTIYNLGWIDAKLDTMKLMQIYDYKIIK